jgi:hypothetical protein
MSGRRQPHCPTVLCCLGIFIFQPPSTSLNDPTKRPSSHLHQQRKKSDIMSFLGGGAECSSAGNPLGRMKSHMSDDKSLQRDRVGGGPSGSAASFRSAPGPVASQDAVRFCPPFDKKNLLTFGLS